MEVLLLYNFDHEPLCTLMKIDLSMFAISDHTTLKLAIQALRSYLKLTCEYEFHIQPNTKDGSLAEVSHLCSF